MAGHDWNPDYYLESPVFKLLHEPARATSQTHRHDWPSLNDYQYLLETFATQTCNQAGNPLSFVAQGLAPQCFEDGYEPRIFLKGEIQTRINNWHDYFQVLIWSLFPRIKSSLNALHYREALKRSHTSPQQTNRGPIENALTLFDECGIIITSDDIKLLEMVRCFQWKELFWQHRERLERRLSCFIFGHALYEKAISPYVGLTGQALLIKTPPRFQALPLTRQASQLDQRLARFLSSSDSGVPFDTGVLTPFPLLGMPAWDSDNDNEHYYNNSEYFRQGRNKPGAPIFQWREMSDLCPM